MSSKISEFKLGKGTSATTGKDGPWTKKYFELTVQLPQQYSEQDFQAALTRAEYMIDTYLGQPETPSIPNVDTEELMKHMWKGKKTGEGQYAAGSLSWGWDFQDKFPPEIIKVLEKGPLVIDKYEFSLIGTMVQTQEKDRKKKR